MIISIDLSYAILSLFVCLSSLIFIIDGWKIIVLRKRILMTMYRITYQFLGLFVDKTRILKWKNWYLSGRRPRIYGWIALLGGFFWLLFGIYLFIEFLKANSFI
ncbi:hypothetical protein ATHL_00986 [Anaerolinea thermolimosa]|nr:hypothetical protein ATHL_00986 [Anaerolinea thermolimosa]